MNAHAPTAVHDLIRRTLDFCTQCLNGSDFSGARQALTRALHLSPDDPEMLSQRGCVALLQKDYEAALADFRLAVQMDDQCASAYCGLARYHLERGNFVEAAAAAKRGQTIGPTDEDTATVLTEAGKQPPLVAPEAANNSRAALNQFHENAANYFADVVPPRLSEIHLRRSRIVPCREDILELMPKGGICAEVGTQTGNFAKWILSTLRPSKLHIYDIDYKPFDHAYFQPMIDQGTVQLHQGDSSTLLGELPDRHFDFIYIDGDHSYDGVVKDLDQSARKIKENGWIVCNDYTIYSPLEKIKYGVYRAVNEFCIDRGFEIIYLGLHPWGYHDVALQRRGGSQ